MAAPISDVSDARASPVIKTEPCEDPLYDTIHDVVEQIKSEDEAQSLLYADHERTEDMVIGPTEIRRPVPVAEPETSQPIAGPSNRVLTVAESEPEQWHGGPSTESLFAVITEDQDNMDVCPSEEVTVGGHDDSDVDVDEDDLDFDDVEFAPVNIPERLYNPAEEDELADDPLLIAADKDNDNELAALLTHLDFDWTSDPTEFTGSREQFTGLPGPTFPVSELAEPVDCFLKMVEPHFIDNIATETNEYARKTIRDLDAAKKLSANSRLRNWTPTTQAEIYRFLALLIAQGLYPNPFEKGYWIGDGRMPLFRNTMTYSRFILLKKFMHFTNNATSTHSMTTAQTRLRKVQPVIDYFRQQFKRLYYPHQEVAINQSLLKWMGLLSFVPKITTKAGKVSIKTYELCDKNGYLWDFFYYTGSNSRLDRTTEPQVDIDAEHDRTSHDMPPPSNATAKIVLDLAEPLFGKGHTIVMDNFYNSPLLARYLKSNRCDCYGTIRLNRQNVPDSLRNLASASMNPGDIKSSYTKDMMVMVWRDARLVGMITTYHNSDVGHKTKHGQTKYKPVVISDYNNAMGGVDRKDQILSAQPMERSRNMTWYKKVFRHLLNTAIFNSHIIYQVKVPKLNHRLYREQIVSGLLRRFPIPRPPPPEFVTSTMVKSSGRAPFKRVTLQHQHFPVNIGATSRCLWCSYKRKKTSRTVYKCKECDVNLCIKHCFEDFHTPD